MASQLPDPDALADILSRASKLAITGDMIRADIAAGAPANEDGTLDLLAYAAWLAKQDLSRGD